MTRTPEYILALDYGNKRIGVAIAHTIARLPKPLMTIANDDALLASITQLVNQEDAGLVLVGLPRGMDGGYTDQTRAAEAFGKTLQTALPVPVEMVDETLSSVDAEATLAGTSYAKADVDALAASYILERYLQENYHGGVAQ